jgi:hypothetical protein
VSDTRAPDTGREHTTGALPRSTPDALMAAQGLDWKAVPPSDSADTELIEAFAPRRRRLTTRLLLIVSAGLGLLVLVGIVVSVLTVSDDSTRPVIPQAPLTPISVPAQTQTQTPTLTTTPVVPPASDLPAPPVPPLPPVTATAETVTTAPAYPREPSNSPRVRDRLHELFPRLFPENP